ncbi:hypothetical protein C8R47DRAFT_1277048, partial [Mycena vitilis]
LALLKSCSDLCGRHQCDLSALLQRKTLFHAHTALYWAIVNQLDSPSAPFELVAALLALSQPLDAATLTDIRRACIVARSQEMFHFFRMCPAVGALSEENRFILGCVVPPEEIQVNIMESPEQAFSVNFRIPMFRKRMMLSKPIEVEFVARDRLWRLSFYTAETEPKFVPTDTQAWFEAKRWGADLRLCENSPGTQLEFALILLDARAPAQPVRVWSHRPQEPFRNEDDSPDDSTNASWMWPVFGDYKGPQADSVCIASDGSVTGVLGAKLRKAETPVGTEGKYKTWALGEIPTKPEDECVVC